MRYNPAVVAQVFATRGYMFPGRVFFGLGRGESLNEVPAGTIWPSNKERFERLEEAIKLIKLLWMENWVTFQGKYYQVKDSNLYTQTVAANSNIRSGDRPPVCKAGRPRSRRLHDK